MTTRKAHRTRTAAVVSRLAASIESHRAPGTAPEPDAAVRSIARRLETMVAEDDLPGMVRFFSEALKRAKTRMEDGAESPASTDGQSESSYWIG